MNSEPSDYTPYDSFGYWIVRMGRHLMQDLSARLELLDVNERQLTVLLSINGAGVNQPSAIACYLDVDRAIIARTLRELQERHLLTIYRHEEDGRSRNVALTEQGKQLAALCAQCSIDTNSKFSAQLPDGFAAAVRKNFRALVEARPALVDNKPASSR